MHDPWPLDALVQQELSAETQALIDTVERCVDDLDGTHLRRASADDPLHELFRAVHSLKGLYGLFGIRSAERLAHELEDLIDAVRSERARFDEGVHALLVEGTAALRQHTTALRLGASVAEPEIAIDPSRRDLIASREMPVGRGLERLVHSARRLARELSKRVRLVVTGVESSLEAKQVAELEPLLSHLLRNAIDHGIEPPEQRATLGKSSEGTIAIDARRSGGCVVVEVEDDGAGVDVATVRRVAAARGLLDVSTTGAMRDRELLRLLFLPAFSTRDEVTGTSGRGVGLDAVRCAVAGLGGAVDLLSEPGRFTRVILTLPTSFATGVRPASKCEERT